MTTGVPVCPRHPDRVTYINCQRCGRPTCQQCARPAAVGVQCVTCVSEAARATPHATAAADRFNGKPVVTYTIMALCVIGYAFQYLTGNSFTFRWMFVPFIGAEEPWRFLTSGFLHANPMHLLFNMWALYTVGPFLEQALGRLRFTALYLLSLFGGSVGVLLFATPGTDSWITGVLGASGAVFGLFGAIVLVLRELGGNARSMMIVIGFNLVFGFVVSGIAWQAHVGGLVVGAILGAAYMKIPQTEKAAGSVIFTAGVAAALVLLTIVKYAGTLG